MLYNIVSKLNILKVKRHLNQKNIRIFRNTKYGGGNIMYQENEFKISESEWLVMHVIWDRPQPVYMGDIVKALSNTPWSRTTIQTMVARLLAKQVVGANKTRYAFQYYPIVSKEDAQKSFTESFIRRVYNGDTSLLIKEIASGDYLTAEEKKVLKKSL